MNLLFFTASLSVFDSLLAAQQIIIFALLLTTIKPLRNSISYLAGFSGAYFICGLLGFLALDSLRSFISKYFPSTENIPDNLYYQSEILSGLIMLVIGIWYYMKKKNAPPGRSQNFIVSKLKSVNWIVSFFTGMVISLSLFPLSIPYLMTLGKYTSLHMNLPTAGLYIFFYNICYDIPMFIVLAIYLYARYTKDSAPGVQHERIRLLNVRLTAWTLAGVGILSIADAAFYYMFGHGLLRGRLF